MAFSLLMQTLHGGSVPAVSMLPLRCENINCRRAPWSEAGQGSVRNFSATFAPGELAGFCGPDGSGKGLLLRVLGMIDKPDSGFLEVLGKNVFAMPEDDARAWRDQTLCPSEVIQHLFFLRIIVVTIDPQKVQELQDLRARVQELERELEADDTVAQ